MSQQFIARVVNYVANEIIVKGLANSRTFQKFAVRTDAKYQEFHKGGVDKMAQTLEEMTKAQAGKTSGAASNAASSGPLQPPQRPLRGIPGFFLAFAKEVRKDFVGK